MLLAFYCHTSISFVFVRYFITFLFIYIFISAFYSSLFKDCRLAVESSVLLKLLTREGLFNFSIKLFSSFQKVLLSFLGSTSKLRSSAWGHLT